LTAELPLAGGNMSSGVVRVGDTVRRPAGPWTPAIHALLGYLHGVGFRGAPRPLGIDADGREVLAFIPGDVAWPHHFHRLDGDEHLRRVGRLIREFHDAVAGFAPPTDAQWQVLIPADGDEIIVHHHLAPWNLILNDQQWTFIDWDVAAPGTRLWDLAYAAHGFVPLSADPAFGHVNAAHRLRIIGDAYGLTERQRLDIVPLLARRTESMHTFLADRAARGVQPWTRLWQEGHGDVWWADAVYIAERSEQWRRALLA
jgi:Phosphotransferase enzyme family